MGGWGPESSPMGGWGPESSPMGGWGLVVMIIKAIWPDEEFYSFQQLKQHRLLLQLMGLSNEFLRGKQLHFRLA